jgi:ParB-like chromosome segregation protein Spo0J
LEILQKGALPQTETHVKRSKQLFDTGEIKLSLKWVEVVPRPTLEEMDHMTQSIKKYGLKNPVTVDQNLMLIDGYSRYKICKRTNTPLEYEVRYFADDKARRDFVLISNVDRRHLKAFDRVRLFRYILIEEQAEAKKRQAHNIEIGRARPRPTGDRVTKHENLSMHRFAKKIGVGEGTAKRALVILDEGSPKELTMVKKGIISITTMYQTIQSRKRRMDERLMPCKITIYNKYTEKTTVIEKKFTRDLLDQTLAYLRRT